MKLPQFLDIDEAAYHAASPSQYMSSHQLGIFRASPYTWHEYATGKLKKAESPALAFGRAAHCRILEPLEEWNRRFCVSDGPLNLSTGLPYGRTSKKFQDFLAKQTKEIVTSVEAADIEAMAEAVWSHKDAHELLANGTPEGTIRVEDFHGVAMQARYDWFSPDYGIVDLKTHGDDLSRFDKACHDFGYAYQMALYRSLLEAVTGEKYPVYVIAVTKSAPFIAAVFKYSEDILDQAEAENVRTIEEFKSCRDSGVYPTRFEETKLISRI